MKELSFPRDSLERIWRERINDGFRHGAGDRSPNDDIEQNDCSNDRPFNVVVKTERQDHRNEENNRKTVGDLSQENLENGNPFSILKLVRSILRKASLCFPAEESMAWATVVSLARYNRHSLG